MLDISAHGSTCVHALMRTCNQNACICSTVVHFLHCFTPECMYMCACLQAEDVARRLEADVCSLKQQLLQAQALTRSKEGDVARMAKQLEASKVGMTQQQEHKF